MSGFGYVFGVGNDFVICHPRLLEVLVLVLDCTIFALLGLSFRRNTLPCSRVEREERVYSRPICQMDEMCVIDCRLLYIYEL